MDASANLTFAWSVIVLLSSLVASGLVLALTVWLSVKRLHHDLSEISQTLQSCALALHKIAGDNSTPEYLELGRSR